MLVRRSYIRIRPTSLACYKPYVMFLNDVINNKLLSYDTFEEKAVLGESHLWHITFDISIWLVFFSFCFSEYLLFDVANINVIL